MARCWRQRRRGDGRLRPRRRILVTGARGLLGGRLAALLARDPRRGRRCSTARPCPPAWPRSLSTSLDPDLARPCPRDRAPGRGRPQRRPGRRRPLRARARAARRLQRGRHGALARRCRARGAAARRALDRPRVRRRPRASSTETEAAAPLLVYGRTKLAAEEAVLAESAGRRRAAHRPRARPRLRPPRHGQRGHRLGPRRRTAGRASSPTSTARRSIPSRSRTRSRASSSATAGAGSTSGGAERLSRYELGLRVAHVLGLPRSVSSRRAGASQRMRPAPGRRVARLRPRARELGLARRARSTTRSADGRRAQPYNRRFAMDQRDARGPPAARDAQLHARACRRTACSRSAATWRASSRAPTPRRRRAIPTLDPAAIAMADGAPRLAGGGAPAGREAEDLFQLGALLTAARHRRAAAEASWRLDGPPPAELSSCRAAPSLAGLAAPRRTERYRHRGEAAPRWTRAPPRDRRRRSALAAVPGRRRALGRAPGAGRRRALRAGWQARAGAVVARRSSPAALVVVADRRRPAALRRPRTRPPAARAASARPSSPRPRWPAASLHVGTDDGDAGRHRRRHRRASATARSSGSWCARRRCPSADGVVVGIVEAKGAGAVVAVDPRRASRSGRASSAPSSPRPRWPAPRCWCGSDDGRCTRSTPRPAPCVWSRKLGGQGARDARGRRRAAVVVATSTAAWPRCASRDGTASGARELGHAVYSSPCLAGAARACRLPRGPRPRPRPRHRRAALRGRDARARGLLAGGGRATLVLAASTDGELLPARRERRACCTAPTLSPPAASSPRPRSTATSVVRGQRRRPARPAAARMKALRVPAWLRRGVLDRYHAGASHLFLLHGNVRDLHPFGDDVRAARGRAAARWRARRRSSCPTTSSAGLVFPGRAREKALPQGARPQAGAAARRSRARADRCSTRCWPPTALRPRLGGRRPRLRAHAGPRGRPAGGRAPEHHHPRALGRGPARSPRGGRSSCSSRPPRGDVSAEVYAGASGAEVVAVPRPDLEARARLRARRCSGRSPRRGLGADRRSSWPRRRAGSRSCRSRTSSSARRGARTPLARDVDRRAQDRPAAPGVRRRAGDPAARATTCPRWAASTTRCASCGRWRTSCAAACTSAAPAGHHPHGPAGHGQDATSPSASPRSAGCSACASGRCAACTSASPSATRRRPSPPSAPWRPWW